MPYVQDEDEPGGAGDGGELASSRILMTVTLAEIVTNFFDKLQSRSSGFASFHYEDAGYEKSDLRKMTFLLNHKPVDALALTAHAGNLEEMGWYWVEKLCTRTTRLLDPDARRERKSPTVLRRATLALWTSNKKGEAHLAPDEKS